MIYEILGKKLIHYFIINNQICLLIIQINNYI
jgi:hypothetical protein